MVGPLNLIAFKPDFMKPRSKRRLPRFLVIILGVALLLAYLLWPLSSRRYHIEFDKKAIQAKQALLQKMAQPRPPASDSLQAPNIIIILADDLAKTDISAYGSPYLQTPHMDSIGLRGVTFEEGYVTSPICSPSRAGLLTGRYPQRFGYEIQPHDRYPHNRMEFFYFKYIMDTEDWIVADHMEYPYQQDIQKQGLPPQEISLGELLKAQGYTTGIVGKWHLGFEEQFEPNLRGFDYQFGFYEAHSLYAPLDAPGMVNQYLDEFTDPYIWGRARKGPCAIRKNGEEIESEEYLTFEIAREAKEFMSRHQDRPFMLYVPFSAPHTPFQAPQSYVDQIKNAKDEDQRVYLAMIKALDDAVGDLMAHLKSLGLEENTLVMFASDNGGATYTGATNNAPLKGGKISNFEGGINVPMMMSWPGKIPPGKRYNEAVSLMDFFVTAVAAGQKNLPEDREYDGVNLLPFLEKDTSLVPHEHLFWRARYNKSVRQGPWKLIVDEKYQRKQLYNLEEDKFELQDKSRELPDKVKDLENKIREWEKGLRDPLWPQIMDFRMKIGSEVFFFAV